MEVERGIERRERAGKTYLKPKPPAAFLFLDLYILREIFIHIKKIQKSKLYKKNYLIKNWAAILRRERAGS
jgi:hypothetical protein